MTSNISRAALVATALLAVLPAFAQEKPAQGTVTVPVQVKPDAEQATGSKFDPAARALLEKMFAAYKKLDSISATIESTMTAKSPNPTTAAATMTATGNLSLRRPSAANVQVNMSASIPTAKEPVKRQAALVSDGKTVYMVDLTQKNYQKQQVTGAASVSQFTSNMGIFNLIGSAFLDPTLQGKMLDDKQGVELALGKADTVNGVECDTVVFGFNRGGNATISLFIGRDDSLLRKVILSAKQQGGESLLTETYADMKANPTLPDSLFAYVPPKGFTDRNGGAKVSVAAKPEEPSLPYSKNLKVGGKPLAFAGPDIAGKPVTLDQYKGKVVLLDFWATWCGPCVAEMPNVVRFYHQYHAKGFDVIGVSLDYASAKKTLVAFTQKNKMPWRQVFSGKDWGSPIAQAYGVEAIPFTVLIGRDGKVAAISVRGAELEAAIQTALAKK